MNKCIHNPVCRHKAEIGLDLEAECTITICCKDFADMISTPTQTKPAKDHPWRGHKEEEVKVKRPYKKKKNKYHITSKEKKEKFSIDDPNDIPGVLKIYKELDRLRRIGSDKLSENQIRAIEQYKGKIMKNLSEPERQQIIGIFKEVKGL